MELPMKFTPQWRQTEENIWELRRHLMYSYQEDELIALSIQGKNASQFSEAAACEDMEPFTWRDYNSSESYFITNARNLNKCNRLAKYLNVTLTKSRVMEGEYELTYLYRVGDKIIWIDEYED